MRKFLQYVLPMALTCAVLAYIVAALPTAPSNAAVYRGSDATNDLACGKAGTLHVGVSDTCKSGVAALTSYQPSMTFSVDNPGGRFIDWDFFGFFCLAGNPSNCVPSNAAIRGELPENHVSLANGPVTAHTPTLTHSGFANNACGSYQYDLEVAVYHMNGSSRVYDCAYGVQDPINAPTRAFYCHTNTTCVLPVKPTPTRTPTPTPTPTTPPQTHFTCVNQSCVRVNGGGDNTCNPIDIHSCEFVTPTPTSIPTPTPTAMPTPTPTGTPTHLACSNNACITVVGAGSNSCTTDSDCQTATHRACVSNACTVVLGSGSDSCSQDSDCQQSSCSGTNCGNNITINNTNTQSQQQQQQQAVLGASVAPATTTTSLPSTGAEDLPILGTLISMGVAGWKMRRWM